LDVDLLIGVGAGTEGMAEVGERRTFEPNEVDLLSGRTTGDCSGVGSGRSRGRSGALDLADV